LKQQLAEGTSFDVDVDSYAYDIQGYQQEKEILNNFLNYRRKFEHSQKIRMQTKDASSVPQSEED
jgi:hypothetical protein